MKTSNKNIVPFTMQEYDNLFPESYVHSLMRSLKFWHNEQKKLKVA